MLATVISADCKPARGCACSNVLGVLCLPRFYANPEIPLFITVPSCVVTIGMALVRQLLCWKAFVDNEVPTGDTRYFSSGKKERGM